MRIMRFILNLMEYQYSFIRKTHWEKLSVKIVTVGVWCEKRKGILTSCYRTWCRYPFCILSKITT